MHRSPPLLALGLFFVTCGIACLVWSLRARKELPANAKKKQLREENEIKAENAKFRIAGGAAIVFGALIVAIS
jgi:hypothetical protein